MPGRGIVRGQKVQTAKKIVSRELRKGMRKQEALLWARLRRNQLKAHFRRQQVIDGFVVDFYCDSAGLVVEVDGEIHSQQREYDEQRDLILAARELKVLRFMNDGGEVGLENVLAKIGA